MSIDKIVKRQIRLKLKSINNLYNFLHLWHSNWTPDSRRDYMRKIIIISLLLCCFVCISNLDAFQNQKQGKHKKQSKSDTVKVVKTKKHKNCCTDSTVSCDRFIDKDRDGINDNRCKGYGVCKQKHNKKNKSK